jgi:ABC-2 type transport system ATP-binding protein
VIEVNNLKKSYKSKLVLDDITFKVEPGVITGFVGPNGAGKSTTMKIIADVEHADSGSCRVDGKQFMYSTSPKQTLGSCMGADFLPLNMSGPAYLNYISLTMGLKNVDVHEILDYVRLSGVGRKKISDYSLGMKQRLGIAAAILGNPSNLMFDEPINGLDIDGIIWLRDLFKSLAQEGKTIFLSSHIMSELEQVADRVIMLDKGKITNIGDVEKLEDESNKDNWAVLIKSEKLEDIKDLLKSKGIEFKQDGDDLTVLGVQAEEVGKIIYSNGLSLSHIEEKKHNLEEIYLESKEPKEENDGN